MNQRKGFTWPGWLATGILAAGVALSACSEDGNGLRGPGAGGDTDTNNPGGSGTDSVYGVGGDTTPDGPFVPPTDTDNSVPNTTAACSAEQDCGAISLAANPVPIWRDGAQAAYSMIFDDFCGYGLRNFPTFGVGSMNARGILGAPGPYVVACEEGPQWDMVREVANQGHEMVNHSYNHYSVEPEVFNSEVVQAKQKFDQELADTWQQGIWFYVYPYDYFTTESINAVMAAGHIGSRAGDRDARNGLDNPPINPNMPTNDSRIEFDVWPRTYSKYAHFQSPDFLWVHVWNAIEAQGWAVREFHSVMPDDGDPSSNGFGPIIVSEFDAHLVDLVDAWKKNQVWTSTPTRIIRYRHTRTKCTPSVGGSQLSYACTGLADNLAGEMSVIITTANDVPGLSAIQGGDPVSVRKLSANTFSVTGHVLNGPVTIAGCADPAVGVESGSIKAKPQPAASVCDLETVVGTGSDGSMDDLESHSSAGEWQALPNPGQADGRTGSWSGYPGAATIEMVETGGNPGAAAHVQANPNSYNGHTGISLAFLGGNGAGACYDANAYAGIQFDIRGTVVGSPSWLGDNIVEVALVTAETMTRAFGGDAPCALGHFYAHVPVTPSWTTQTIRWNQFTTPNYLGPDCAAAGIYTHPATALPLGKLQAIDWGFYASATTVDVYIDNVRLITN